MRGPAWLVGPPPAGSAQWLDARYLNGPSAPDADAVADDFIDWLYAGGHSEAVEDQMIQRFVGWFDAQFPGYRASNREAPKDKPPLLDFGLCGTDIDFGVSDDDGEVVCFSSSSYRVGHPADFVQLVLILSQGPFNPNAAVHASADGNIFKLIEPDAETSSPQSQFRSGANTVMRGSGPIDHDFKSGFEYRRQSNNSAPSIMDEIESVIVID